MLTQSQVVDAYKKAVDCGVDLVLYGSAAMIYGPWQRPGAPNDVDLLVLDGWGKIKSSYKVAGEVRKRDRCILRVPGESLDFFREKDSWVVCEWSIMDMLGESVKVASETLLFYAVLLKAMRFPKKNEVLLRWAWARMGLGELGRLPGNYLLVSTKRRPDRYWNYDFFVNRLHKFQGIHSFLMRLGERDEQDSK